MRKIQTKQYGNHPKLRRYQRFRPRIHQPWLSADLKNFSFTKTLFRLRCGHSNLFFHDKLSQYLCCPCGPKHTPHHIFFECTITQEYVQARKALFLQLQEFISFKDKPELSQILSPPRNHSLKSQRKFLTLVAQFAQKHPHPP